MSTKNNYVEVLPNKIILSRSFSQTFYEAKLTLTNVIDRYVVFKVYINKSSQYSSNPSTGFIKPNDSININIKRLEKDVGVNENTKDKFLIIAFPVNKVIQDNDEAKIIIKTTDLKAPINQEIYLEAEYDSAHFDKRSTMQQMPSNRISASPEDLRKSQDVFASANNYVDNVKSVNSMMQNLPTERLSETKKQIEEIKKDIQNYEKDNDKLNSMLNNYASNSMLFKTKSKVLTGESEKKSNNNKFPLPFVVFLLTLGLMIGAYVNKMISY